MNKHKTLVVIIGLMIIVYTLLSFLLSSEMNTNFWIGFSFVVLSLIIMGITTFISTERRSSAFPLEISIVILSIIYVVTVFVLNTIFNYVLVVKSATFFSIHLVSLAILIILTLLMVQAKAKIIKQNNDTKGMLVDIQHIIFDLEKIKTRLIKLPSSVQKPAVSLIDELLDELKFADFSLSADVADLDYQIQAKILLLSTELDNLIEIQTDDLGTLKTVVDEIKQLVKERNMQIKLLDSNSKI